MADVNPMKVYQEDPRIACKYGAKCYQKNPVHHQRYKHPPTTSQKAANDRGTNRGRKRKIDSNKESQTSLPKAKVRKDDTSELADKHRLSPTPSLSSDEEDDTPKASESHSESSEEGETSKTEEDEPNKIYESPGTTNSECSITPEKADEDSKSKDSPENSELSKKMEKNVAKSVDSAEVETSNDTIADDYKNIIKEIFLMDMPKDFYRFYEFSCELSPKAPESVLKVVGLEFVGPFDVLFGKIKKINEDKEKYLRHWRYFYDPPEFQTILKGNDKDGLHFGYWRDEDDKLPVFVAKNCAKKDCKIIPVAENLFGAVSAHTEQRLKLASPFEKANVSRLLQKLKTYAKNNNITLEQETLNMRARERKSVTKTFHGAGIVVPYDKKTQLGYRTLAATDSQLKAILRRLENGDENTKKEQMSSIDEIVRLTTIAADECDFGTPLELAHDLFSSGIPDLQNKSLQMFKMSYSLLHRPVFIKIIESHLKDRKKDCNLSVL